MGRWRLTPFNGALALWTGAGLTLAIASYLLGRSGGLLLLAGHVTHFLIGLLWLSGIAVAEVRARDSEAAWAGRALCLVATWFGLLFLSGFVARAVEVGYVAVRTPLYHESFAVAAEDWQMPGPFDFRGLTVHRSINGPRRIAIEHHEFGSEWLTADGFVGYVVDPGRTMDRDGRQMTDAFREMPIDCRRVRGDIFRCKFV